VVPARFLVLQKERGLPVKRIIRAGILLVLLLCLCGCGKSEKTLFQEKEALLREQMLAETLVQELGLNPAGDVGYAVFFSVSDGQKRAEVYAGIGSDVDAAWSAAAEKTVEGLKKSKTQPLWVKTDAVFISDTYTISQLEEAVREARSGFLRFGVAFDNRFHTALLETELNCCGAYDYEEGTLSLEKLNGYLKANGKAQLTAWPEQVTVFQTFGRFCDENNQIHKITSSGYSCGRREVDVLDASCAETVLRDAGEYLAAQLQVSGINIERDSVSRIEIGTRFVADYEIRELARLLNVSVSWLLGLE